MWKDTVNETLASLTGYRLQRVGTASTTGPRRPTPAQQAARQAERRAARQAERRAERRAERQAEREAEREAERRHRRRERRRARRVPRHYDDAATAVIARVKPRTMTSHEKLFGLILATRYVVAHQVPGAIVECGVWRGGSMQSVALTLLEQGHDDRDLHLFDTFEGMSEPTEEDRRIDGSTAADLLATHERESHVWAVAGLDDVREAMSQTSYPAERVHFHVGKVEQTVPDAAPEQIAILRLDTDWYASTKHELEHLYDRLAPGGVLIIDDYGHWEGSRLATEEFFAATAEPLLLLPLSSGRIAVKPR